ncbi:LOG family protein, partial [Phascolarctobacterium succinatutens]|uniref:LOG family protein n=1 Tax=Phascolarctobacterium succinatutens TaxID=626940 RepID=UPI003076A305
NIIIQIFSGVQKTGYISLGQLQAPCIYYNLDGYYDDIKHFLQQMIAKGFSSEEKQQGVYFAESLKKIKELLK